jgi:hypothetical protein
MQIFWLYVFVLLTPAASLGLLIAFINTTAGAMRSLVQMLHLECIFTLPDAPASWAEEGENKDNDHRLDGESTVRPTMAQEEHDRLVTMDEHDLAAAVASHTRESRTDAGRISEQEEGGSGEEKPREGNSNTGLYQL